MKNKAMEFREEYLKVGDGKVHGSGGFHHYGKFADWLKSVNGPEALLAGGRLPSTTFFAVRVADGRIVGVTNIRHFLIEQYRYNGHIGYSVRPSERRKGYGTELLRLALIKAEQIGIIETIVSCNKSNTASKRVIEKNGLALEQEFAEDDGNLILVYKTI
jgi:predicted acetyltransferase